MRTLTDQQSRTLSERNRSVFLRVFVDRTGAGGWVDLSSLEGRDWIDSVEYGESNDISVSSATVRLKAKHYHLTLATLVDGSKLNDGGTLIDVGQKIYIETATLPSSRTTPTASDWVEVFRGEIDAVAWNTSPIEVWCRDKGAQLDRFIEDQALRPSSGAFDDIEDISQEILDAIYGSSVVEIFSENGTGATPFQTSDSPGFAIEKYKQGKMPVIQALRRLWDQIGWFVRYKWNTSTGAFELTAYEPGRSLGARGTLTFTGLPLSTQKLTLNGTDIVGVVGAAGTDEFQVTSFVETTVDSLVNAINTGSESANAVAWKAQDTSGNWLCVVQWSPGTAGNLITFTETMDNVTADGSTTLGGTRAGTDLVVAHTFGPEDYISMTRLGLSRADVRNKIRLKYGTKKADRATLTLEDAASVTKFGPRFMEIAESGSSQINLLTEARSMGEAILEDLKDPTLEKEIELPYFWPAEVGDYYTFTANGVHYDTDQSLAVVAVRHRLNPKLSRTVLSVRGKPSGGFKRWLGMEARAGLAPGADFFDDADPSSVVAGATLAGITVSFDDPRTMSPPIDDWAFTKVWISKTTPVDTSGAPDAVRRDTRFEFTGLEPDTLYYAVPVHVDAAGNESTGSTEVSATTLMAGAYHANPDDLRRNMVLNGDFGQATLAIASNPPDGWFMNSGTWGTGAVEETTINETGGRSIKIPNGTGSVILESAVVPVSVDQLYRLEVRMRSSARLTKRPVFSVEFFDEGKSSLGVLSMSPSVAILGADNTWETQARFFYPRDKDVDSRFAKVRLSWAGADTADIYFDYVQLTRAGHQFKIYENSNLGVSTGTLYEVNTDSIEFSHGDITISSTDYGAATGNGRFRVLVPGSYAVFGAVTMDSLTAGTVMEVGLTLNGVEYVRGTRDAVASTGDVQFSAAAVIDLVKDDEVRVYVKHDEGITKNLVGGALETYLQVTPVDLGA